MKMFKKGQAAMEFLMTYGWAILVVLAAIAALAYFGVLSPDSLMQEKTISAAPIPNLGNAVLAVGAANSGTVDIPLQSNEMYPFSLISINSTGGQCGGVVVGSATASVNKAAYVALNTAAVQPGQTFIVHFNCTTAMVAGKFKDDFVMVYNDSQTGMVKKQSISVLAKVK